MLEAPIVPEQLTKNSTIYTYPNAPQFPGPISRSLNVIALVESSHPVVQKLLGGSNGSSSDVMTKCTIGVKQLHPSLKDHDKVNSTNFAKFMTKLRRTEVVAILSKDKYGRFGMLQPMMGDGDDDEKFAADCYIGDMKEAKGLFSSSGSNNNGGNSVAAAKADDGLWQPGGPATAAADSSGGGDGVWQPSSGGAAAETSSEGLWQPSSSGTTGDAAGDGVWQPSSGTTDDAAGSGVWQPDSSFGADTGTKRNADEMEQDDNNDDGGGGDVKNEFHQDVGAATADAFYSGLTRTLDTRSESRLFHMRSFNGWVKATQIQELNPHTMEGKKKRGNAPMRILDLACGKGGDLGKWILHPRRMSNYVGVDVARGSLRDAAVRSRALRNKMERCTFTCADLGADVPGRLASAKKTQMQKLLSWSLLNESVNEKDTPEFKPVRGGGIDATDKFDVVSIQFAIHYMMSTKKRARRFFRTVSELLEIGGNLIATTIDARVVMEHLMNLGEDLHFDSENEDKEDPKREIVVRVGAGACRIRFQRHIVKKIFKAAAKQDGKFCENVFGLEYTFTLVEGSDHAAGVGEAVDLPEWLTPIPILKELAEEAGLEMEYGQNFHEFFKIRKDPQNAPAAHLALYNMKVLNKNGSISADEWEISRLYCAVKFRKVREAQSILEDDDDDANDPESEPEEEPEKVPEKPNPKLLMKAMLNAKVSFGKDKWETLSGDEKKRLTQVELGKLASK